MFETLLITLIVAGLAGVSVYALRRRSSTQALEASLLEGDFSDVRLVDLVMPHEAVFVSMQSLFRDEDYYWLRDEQGLKVQAELLKRRRIRLARRYLQLLREDFDRLVLLHGFLVKAGVVGQAQQDEVATMALKFKVKIMMAALMLPLNYVRLNLSAMEEFSRMFQGIAGQVRQQMPVSLAN